MTASHVNAPLVWAIVGVCAAAGLVHQLRARVLAGFYAEHRSWREAPRAFATALADAVMSGLGFGLAAATVFTLLALALARLG